MGFEGRRRLLRRAVSQEPARAGEGKGGEREGGRRRSKRMSRSVLGIGTGAEGSETAGGWRGVWRGAELGGAVRERHTRCRMEEGGGEREKERGRQGDGERVGGR